MSWLIEEQIKSQIKSKDIDLLISTPTRDGKVTQHWLLGKQELELPQGQRIAISMESGQPVDISRNISITKALQGNAKHILFWDSDVIPPKHSLNTILSLQLPVVGCVYRSRGPPYQLLASSQGAPLPDSVLSQPQVVECDTIGAGFLLVDLRVIKKYARKMNNWQCLSDHSKISGEFVSQYQDKDASRLNYRCERCHGLLIASFFDFRAGKTRKLPISEDYYFCYKVKELGFKIFCCTINCIHENSFCYVGDKPQLETWLASASDVK